MPQFDVILPVCGFISHTVEADTEEQAIEVALEMPFEVVDIQDANVYEHVNEGNVCNLPYTDAEASENDEETDEETQQAEKP